jgi:transcriptional regulator with XRE-family HTH domain
MSTILDNDPTPLIAQRLRKEREKRQWSLDDLALHTGVSKAMLSKLERCEASPTAALLGRISGALGMTLSSLLAVDNAPQARLVRVADQPTWQDPATQYIRRQVSPLSDMPVQLVEVELPPGQSVSFPGSAYSFVRQLIWVLAGSLAFDEGGHTHHLHVGDCLELGAPAECSFHNRTRTLCRYLVVVARR